MQADRKFAQKFASLVYLNDDDTCDNVSKNINNKKYISRLCNKVEGYILLLLVSFPSSLVLLYFKVGGRPVTKDHTLTRTYTDASVTLHNHGEGRY